MKNDRAAAAAAAARGPDVSLRRAGAGGGTRPDAACYLAPAEGPGDLPAAGTLPSSPHPTPRGRRPRAGGGGRGGGDVEGAGAGPVME